MPPQYRRQNRSSAILWILVVIVLIALAFYFGSHYAVAPAPVTVVQEGSEYYSNPTEWQTYTDSTAGYSIAYPIDFATDEPPSPKSSTDWLVNNPTQAPGFTTFTLTVPAAFEPQTNFLDATLSIGYSTNSKAISNCLIAQNGEATSTTSAANNATFTVFTSSNPGAGNLYDTTSYRTTHAGACYAVEYTIHSTELGNYPASYDLTQFDEQQVSSLLDRIVGTFTFL